MIFRMDLHAEKEIQRLTVVTPKKGTIAQTARGQFQQQQPKTKNLTYIGSTYISYLAQLTFLSGLICLIIVFFGILSEEEAILLRVCIFLLSWIEIVHVFFQECDLHSTHIGLIKVKINLASSINWQNQLSYWQKKKIKWKRIHSCSISPHREDQRRRKM